MHRYNINIPQGFSGRLKLDSSGHYNIFGLYTSGFSSCNIIAVIGKTRLALFHYDSIALPIHLTDDVEWVLEDNSPADTDIVVIYRDEGRQLLSTYDWYLNDFISKKHRVVKQLLDATAYDGVYLCFNRENALSNSVYDDRALHIHSNIVLLPGGVEPLGTMIHHPLEQKLVTIRKIQQLTGLQAKKQQYLQAFESGIISAKNDQCIFLSGSMWQPIAAEHLNLDLNQPFVSNIINRFSKSDNHIKIINKINKAVKYIGHKFAVEESVSMSPIAMNIEDYLHDYNHRDIFANNIKSLFVKDRNLQDKLSNILQTANDANEVMRYILSCGLRITNGNISLVELFVSHYNIRQKYLELNKQYIAAESEAKKLIKMGDQACLCGQYEVAVRQYMEAMLILKVRTIVGDSLAEDIKNKLKQANQEKEAREAINPKVFLPSGQINYLNYPGLCQGCVPPPNKHEFVDGRTVILSPMA